MSGKWRKYKGIKCYRCNNEAPCCSCRALNRTWAGFPMQLQERWQVLKFERQEQRRKARQHG